MNDNLEIYFYDNIIVPYYEYIGDTESGSFERNNDLRKSVDCAIKLYHLREHLDPKPNYSDVILRCPEYKIVQDVTNLSKHNSLSRGTPVISSLSQIVQLQIITQFKDEIGEYSDIDKVIEITKDDGAKIFLHDMLYKVISFWNDYLYNEGLISKKFNIKFPNPIGELKERAACKKLDIIAIQGMPFEMHYKFMKWDYKENKAIPIDLTGTMVEFNVYKKQPEQILELQVQDSKTGEVILQEINLSQEDLDKFNLLGTNEEKEKFVTSLDYVQEFIKTKLKELTL